MISLQVTLLDFVCFWYFEYYELCTERDQRQLTSMKKQSKVTAVELKITTFYLIRRYLTI